MSIALDSAREQFQARFGAAPEAAARAPGRVNIIGEHTDYNHGFVLPMAIEQETLLLARPRPDRVLNAYAANLDRAVRADLDRRERNPEEPWIDYLLGVAEELTRLGRPLTGADALIIGDVPLGCGLSSSASLEMAALALFEHLGGYALEGPEAAQLGRRVENDYLGLSSGIMDQFIARMGQKGHALFLDCRSLEFQHIPAALPGAVFVIANTCVTRGLTSSKYNERVAQCNEAVAALQAAGGQGSHLRDFTLEALEAARPGMSDTACRRARHVIAENERTQAACRALQAGDAEQLGALMNASDASLRDDYEVTCPELDAMTAIARGIEGCFGARMTGAGFGGCTISLAAADKAAAFCRALLAAYQRETGLEGAVIASRPAQGASAARIMH